MSDHLDPRRATAKSDISRLSVTPDGRLFWDDKPVVVRRRLQLSRWQMFGLIVVSLAALIIAASAAVYATVIAHEWMCSAKWVRSYCPQPPPAPPAPAPHLEVPN
jgi:hypothetical protein